MKVDPTITSPLKTRPVVIYTRNIHEVLFRILKIDLWTLTTLIEVYETIEPNLPINHHDEVEIFEKLLDEEVLSLYQMDVYEVRFEMTARMCLDQSSDELILERLNNTRTYRYYAQMLKLRILLHRVAQSKRMSAEKARNLTLLKDNNIDSGTRSPDKQFEHLIAEVTQTQEKLIDVVKDIRSLCDWTKAAIEKRELDDASLDVQKLRMAELGLYFQEACKELGEVPSVPIASERSGWWSVIINI